MEDKHNTTLLLDYLEGKLSQEAQEALEERLANSESLRKELAQLQLLMEAFEREPQETPSPQLQANFEAMLQREMEAEAPKVIAMPQRKHNTWAIVWQVAAGLALLLAGYGVGSMKQDGTAQRELASMELENQQMKQTAVLSLMENESASKRIQGFQYVQEFSDLDKNLAQVLVNKMQRDENANVRLAAVEGLQKFLANPEVGNAYLTALKTEKDPGVQIAIIHILVNNKEKRAVKPFKELLKNDDTPSFVKDQIETLMPKII